MSLPKVVVVGGHGKIALHFARLASPSHSITSLVRSDSHFKDIQSHGATPLLLSLEDACTADLATEFEGAKAVVFSAGAGGKGGPERTKAVDFHGAVKVFDAIEAVKGEKPRLLLVSAIDTRDMSKPPPAHYSAKDIAESLKVHEAIGTYYQWKLEADRNLHTRTSFQWTILRPGHLLDDAGTGKVEIGRTGLGSIPREDVAAVLLALVDEPGASGLALDLIQGSKSVKDAVHDAVVKGESDHHD
ncbi:NAD(P)-binding protein [Meredithblackwellia eburnea MCA 4105]